MASQITHGMTGFALTWEHHTVSPSQLVGIVCQYGLHTHTLERITE